MIHLFIAPTSFFHMLSLSLSLSLYTSPYIAHPKTHMPIHTLKMAPNFSLILCIVSIFSILGANGATHHHTAPAPAVDCSNLVLSMADCLSFVSNGSTTTKPEGTCCSGLKTVLKTDAECLCEAFKSSAQLGVVLNLTKAMTLPAACKLHAPSASNCGLALSPAAAPGLSPLSSPTAAAPTVTAGANVVTPAPSPANAGYRGFSISVGSLAIGLVIASFSSF